MINHGVGGIIQDGSYALYTAECGITPGGTLTGKTMCERVPENCRHRAITQQVDVGQKVGPSAYEHSVVSFRMDPRMRSFVEKNYLEEGLAEAVSRFVQSEQFSLICSALKPYIDSGARLADLGAGRGLTSLALAGKGARVTSVEYNPSGVVGLGALAKHLRLHPQPLALVRGDVLQLLFSDTYFDVAFCRGLLHHLGDLRQGVREIWRILKPGGIFLASNEHILSPFSNGKKFLDAHPAVAYGVNESAYSAWTYWWTLRMIGFHRIRFFGYDGEALQFSEFLRATERNPVRARLVALPVVGRSIARILHVVHAVLRRHLRYLFVPEESLPVISIVAQKPLRGDRGIRRA